MKDALDESLLLSDKIIQELTAEILNHAGALYKASEAVSVFVFRQSGMLVSNSCAGCSHRHALVVRARIYQ